MSKLMKSLKLTILAITLASFSASTSHALSKTEFQMVFLQATLNGMYIGLCAEKFDAETIEIGAKIRQDVKWFKEHPIWSGELSKVSGAAPMMAMASKTYTTEIQEPVDCNNAAHLQVIKKDAPAFLRILEAVKEG